MPSNKWIFVIVTSLFLSGISALTRRVDINGTGQYTSIQTAVTASSPGDTVLVYPGRYYENISLSINNLILVSLEHSTNDPSFVTSTIIDGGLNSSGIRINQNIQNIGIRGFSITNCKSGISLGENSSSMITNCDLFGNASAYGGGINVYKCTTGLRGLRIYDNYAYIMGGGMYINGYMGAVSVTFDPVNLCSIYNNTAGAGQDIVAHSINNDLSIPLQKFTVANPTSYYAAPYRAWGNEFQLNISSVEVHHQEINSDLYVSPNGDDNNDGLSPASALKTIKTAIYRIASDSLEVKTVHILPGTYSRTANQQIFPIALKSWVHVQCAGIDETNIVGEMDPAFAGSQNYTLSVFSSFYQDHAYLSDLSITTQNSDNSCAILGYDESNMELSKLRIHNLNTNDNAAINIAYNRACLWDEILVEDIITPKYGLIQCAGYFTGVIRNSIFRNATSTYISNEVWARPLVIITAGQHLLIENTTFSNITMLDDDSQAIQIGGVSNPAFIPQYTVQNCLFSNINCNVRAVLIHGSNNPVINIINCTFAGQTGNGHALMVNGDATITNCIFYNDRPYEIAVNPMDNSGIVSTLTLDYNLIKGGFNGIQQAAGNTINYYATNISGNPLFAGGDDVNDPLYYSLSDISPCINAGTPDISGLQLLPYDLAGNWRVWDNRIDMGAYEYGSVPWVSNDDPYIPEVENAISATNYPNPFNPSTTIAFSLPKAGLATVEIYNLKGQKVRSLLHALLPSGGHKAVWDGTNDQAQSVSSGIYFYRVGCGEKVYTGKMIMVK